MPSDGPVSAPPDRHRLSGLQAASQPDRLRQRRLRAAGDRRAAVADPAKVPEILRLVGLQAKIHNYPDELSGGEQQRVAIARAFVNHPPLLLADEPTGNLDPVTSIGIMQLLYRINRTGTTVLVVTHDREMVDKMRRRVIALEEGRLIRDQAAGGYTRTSRHNEFAARVRAEMGVGDEGGSNGNSTSSTEVAGGPRRLLPLRGVQGVAPQRGP